MRMLFCCLPLHGHAYPLVALANAARAAGHDVEFATGAAFADRLRRLGYPTHLAGITLEEGTERVLAERPELAEVAVAEPWRLGVRVFVDAVARAVLDDLAPIIADGSPDRPDLVVHEEFNLGAGLAATLAGIPSVEHSLSRQLAPEILAEAQRLLFAVRQRDYRANAYLDICPPSLQLPGATTPGPRFPIRPVPHGEPDAALPAWIGEPRTRPLIYLTFGTYVYGAIDALRAAAAGLGTVDCDLLVTVGPDGDPAALGPLPDSVRVERFVPHEPLLPHLDLVVHHGGSGTMFGGLTHGLPQLILPQGADQFTNAEALVDSGAGLALLPADITTESVAAAARTLLTNHGYREAARRVAREIADMPPPGKVVPLLERLVLPESAAFG